MIHGLFGSYTAHRQGITTALDHGISGGIGEKMGGAACGFATADLVVMGLIHGAMGGQRDQIDGDAALAFAQALGNHARQEFIDMAFKRVEVVGLLGQGAQDVAPEGAPWSWEQA